MRIVIATGGSGGHIFPALQVAKELTKSGHEVFFVGNFGVGTSQIQQSRYPHFPVSAQGFGLYPLNRLVGSTFSSGKGMVESFKILKTVKPDVVCGFGGYSSLPVMVVAALLKYPTIIHEQNVLPGKANRVLSSFVRKIAITFQETQEFLYSDKIIWTGCPSHAQRRGESKDHLAKQFQLETNKLTILVLGGSQGSHKINTEFMKTIRLLREHLDFQVIHLCGKSDYSQVEIQYRESAIRFSLHDFLDDVGPAYQLADLVISRAGAVTVLEIAQFQVPAILIPYPFAGGHQQENAKILLKTNAARIIEEKDFTPKTLKNAIIDLLTKRPSMEEIQRSTSEFLVSDAAQKIAQAITQLT